MKTTTKKTAKKSTTKIPPEKLAHITPALRALAVPIEQLTLDPDNANEHSNENLNDITGSINEFGQVKPVVVDKDGIVRAGNGTVRAMMSKGYEYIAAVRDDSLDGLRARAYAIIDNKAARSSKFNRDILNNQFVEVNRAKPSLLSVCGFGSDIDKIIGKAGKKQPSQKMIPHLYHVVIECKTEKEQKELATRMKAEGFIIKLQTM